MPASPPDPEEEPRVKRLMYHAKQRGWLELDLIIGNWAEANRTVLATDPVLMADFEALLAVENPNLFKYLTGQLDPTGDEASLDKNAAFQAIKEQVRSRYRGAATRTEWIANGWQD